MIKVIKDEITRRPFLAKIISSFGFLVSERAIRILVGIFIHAQIARYLGPEGFGKLNYITRWVAIFAAIPIYGMDDLVVRDLLATKDKQKANSIILTVSVFRIVASIVAFFLLGLSLLVLQSNEAQFSLLALFFGLVLLLSPLYTFELSFLKSLNIKDLFHARITSYGITTGLKSLGCLTGMPIVYFLAVTMLENLIVSIFVVKRYLKSFFEKHWRFERSYLKGLLKNSTPVFAAGFVLLIDQRLSMVFIERYCSPEELGNYTVAQTLVDLLSFIPLAISTSLFPTLVTAFEVNNQKFKHRLQQYSDLMLWTSYLFIAGTWLVAPFVISILYGSKYTHADELLKLTIITTFFSHLNLVRFRWFTIERKLNIWLAICILNLLISAGFQYHLTPRHQSSGAIIGYLLANMCSNILMAIFIKEVRISLGLALKSIFFPVRLFRKIKHALF